MANNTNLNIQAKSLSIGFSTKLFQGKYREPEFICYKYPRVLLIFKIKLRKLVIYRMIPNSEFFSIELNLTSNFVVRRKENTVELILSSCLKFLDFNNRIKPSPFFNIEKQILRFWTRKPILRLEFDSESVTKQFLYYLDVRESNIYYNLFSQVSLYNDRINEINNYQQQALTVLNRLHPEIGYLVFCILSSGILKYPIDIPIKFLEYIEKKLNSSYQNNFEKVYNCLINLMTVSSSFKKRYQNIVIDNIYDEFFKIMNKRLRLYPETINNGKVYLKRIYLSENMIYFQLPMLEETNSVLRTYIDKKDRFIRLSFTNDLFERPNYWTNPLKNLVDTIVLPILKNGLLIGETKYSFLCYSNSQLKSYSVWMINETQGFNFDSIFSKMGDFSKEKIVSKNASRRGMCLSTSQYLQDIENIELITDYEKTSDEYEYCKRIIKGVMVGKYNFTDGIGKISLDLALKAARLTSKEYASAFQIRIGGAKGVIAVDKNLPNNTICLRQSMIKFQSNNRSLNIIRASNYTPAFLNRHIILLLEYLGIKENVFLNLTDKVLKKYNGILRLDYGSEDLDMIITTGFVKKLYQVNILRLKNKECVRSNIFILKLSHYLMMSFLNLLRTKMKIHVEKAGTFLGVIDEFNVLKEGQVFLRINKDRKGSLLGHCNTITGKVLVTRNPCLYPGDIHILEAVDSDNEDLNLYINVIVFPKAGPIPLPHLMGGGDLDGDVYFVSWEIDLIPNKIKLFPSLSYKGEILFKSKKVL